jgi:hypothetical protein
MGTSIALLIFLTNASGKISVALGFERSFAHFLGGFVSGWVAECES